ncbi:MAG: copper resistance CopC/CopD family protein [Acidimicrobiia bacterium]
MSTSARGGDRTPVRSWRHGAARAGAIVLFVLAQTLAWPSGSASAHPVLVRSQPSAGARLDTAPAEVRLWFSEVVVPAYARIEVRDAKGRSIGGQGRNDDKIRVIPDEPTGVARRLAVPEGRYRVAWRVLSSSDGHVVTGEFDFVVGEAATHDPPAGSTAPSEASSPDASDSSPEEVPLRIAVFVVASWLVGGAVLRGAVLRGAVLRGSPGPVPIRGPAVALLVASSLSVASWAWRAAPTPGDLPGLLGLPLGRILVARELLATGILLAAMLRPGAVLWLGLAFLATLSASSHATATGDALAPILDWLHLAAGAIWAGGLGHLALLAWRWRGPESGAPLDWGQAVRRFSRLAMAATATLAATGLYRSAQELVSSRALTGTTAGRLIAAKAILFLAAVCLGASHLWRRRRRGSHAQSNLRPEGFRRNLLFELGLLYLAFGTAGLLTAEPPGRLDPAVNALRTTGRAGDWGYELELRPGWVGPNDLRLTVNPTGPLKPSVPQPNLARLALGIEQHPGHTVWVEEIALARVAPGEFVGRADKLAVSWKTWKAQATLSNGQGEQVGGATFPLLEAAAALTPGPPLPLLATVGLVVLSAGAGGIGLFARSRRRKRWAQPTAEGSAVS